MKYLLFLILPVMMGLSIEKDPYDDNWKLDRNYLFIANEGSTPYSPPTSLNGGEVKCGWRLDGDLLHLKCAIYFLAAGTGTGTGNAFYMVFTKFMPDESKTLKPANFGTGESGACKLYDASANVGRECYAQHGTRGLIFSYTFANRSLRDGDLGVGDRLTFMAVIPIKR
jgi:hypothetical protein